MHDRDEIVLERDQHPEDERDVHPVHFEEAEGPVDDPKVEDRESSTWAFVSCSRPNGPAEKLQSREGTQHQLKTNIGSHRESSTGIKTSAHTGNHVRVEPRQDRRGDDLEVDGRRTLRRSRT